FAMRLQQLTAPVMAKGLEDTAFYRTYALASLNEVGGGPKKFGFTLDEFHHFVRGRLKNWPFSMTSTSTHDSKRSEDVRARLNVLSEISEPWIATVSRWCELNREHKVTFEIAEVPDWNEEYL